MTRSSSDCAIAIRGMSVGLIVLLVGPCVGLAQITYPAGLRYERRVSIGNLNAPLEFYTPSSPLADFEVNRFRPITSANTAGEVGTIDITQRSILRADRIDISCTLAISRPLGTPLLPGVFVPGGDSFAAISFVLSEPTSYSAYFGPVIAGSEVSVYSYPTVGLPFFVFGAGGISNPPPQFGVLPAGRYELYVIAQLQDIGVGAASRAAGIALVLPSPSSAAAFALAGVLIPRRRRSSSQSTK